MCYRGVSSPVSRAPWPTVHARDLRAGSWGRPHHRPRRQFLACIFVVCGRTALVLAQRGHRLGSTSRTSTQRRTPCIGGSSPVWWSITDNVFPRVRSRRTASQPAQEVLLTHHHVPALGRPAGRCASREPAHDTLGKALLGLAQSIGAPARGEVPEVTPGGRKISGVHPRLVGHFGSRLVRVACRGLGGTLAHPVGIGQNRAIGQALADKTVPVC